MSNSIVSLRDQIAATRLAAKTSSILPSALPPIRLGIILDATASREAAWSRTFPITKELFLAASALAPLSVQLISFAGEQISGFDWTSDPVAFLANASSVRCIGGNTMYWGSLAHFKTQHDLAPLSALILFGDAWEEAPVDDSHLFFLPGGGKVPIFGLYEDDSTQRCRESYNTLARLTHGASLPLDATSIPRLKDLLRAIITFIHGGEAALLKSASEGAKLLLSHLK